MLTCLLRVIYIQICITLVNNSEWDNNVKLSAKWWQLHLKRWIDGELPVLIVKFENLLVDLKTELQRMLDFLGYPYTEDDLNCTIKSNTKQFQRKHSENAINRYTVEQKKHVNLQLQKANKILQIYNITYEEQ